MEFRQHKTTVGEQMVQQQLNINVHNVRHHTTIHGQTLQAMLQQQTTSVQCAHKNGIMIGILGAHGQHQVTIKHTAEQEHVQHVHM